MSAKKLFLFLLLYYFINVIINFKVMIMKNVKTRNSNLELLRIFSMALIIMHHYACHSTLEITSPVIYHVLIWGGKIGVMSFLLITGYFQVNSEFKSRKLFKLVFQVLFYSYIYLLLFYIFDGYSLTSQDKIFSIIPLISKNYWFISIYVFLYILSPFLNKIIKSFSKDTFKHLLILFIIYFFGIKTFIYGNAIEFFESVLGFIFFYFLGAYIRLYKIDFFEKLHKKNIVLAFGIIFFLVFLNVLNIRVLSNYFIYNSTFNFFRNYISLISTYQVGSIFTLVSTLCIFHFFKNLNIKNNKFINFMASTTFGCYLIHDNTLVRPFLWQNLFDMKIVMVGSLKALFSSDAFILNKIFAVPMVFISDTFNLPVHFFLPIHCLLIIIFILFVCSIIEVIRVNFIEKHFRTLLRNNKRVNNFIVKFDNWINA